MILDGAANAPPALPVIKLSLVGSISPLSLLTLPVKVNELELFKCGIVLLYVELLVVKLIAKLLNAGVPGALAS